MGGGSGGGASTSVQGPAPGVSVFDTQGGGVTSDLLWGGGNNTTGLNPRVGEEGEGG